MRYGFEILFGDHPLLTSELCIVLTLVDDSR